MTWPTKLNFKNPASEMFCQYMTGVHAKLPENLEKVRELMGNYYNKKCRMIEDFKKGELVMLNGKKIRFSGRCRKLEDNMYGPFKIVSVGYNNRYCKLELPASWNIHPTFSVSLLDRYRGVDPGKQVVKIEADDPRWKMESIISSGPSNDNATKHMFSAKWQGYLHEKIPGNHLRM